MDSAVKVQGRQCLLEALIFLESSLVVVHSWVAPPFPFRQERGHPTKVVGFPGLSIDVKRELGGHPCRHKGGLAKDKPKATARKRTRWYHYWGPSGSGVWI